MKKSGKGVSGRAGRAVVWGALAALTALALVAQGAAAANGNDYVKPGVIVYPKPGAVFKTKRPVIGADFIEFSADPAKLSPRLFVDGVDVSAQCDLNDGYLFYMPDADLGDGPHKAALKFKPKQGRETLAAEWTFHIGWPQRVRFTYPQAGGKTTKLRPTIGVKFDELPFKIDPRGVKLIVDGVDVTDKCELTDGYIFYRPPKDLPTGSHSAVLKASAGSGAELDPLAWKFSVEKGPEIVVAPTEAPVEKAKAAAAITGGARRENTIADAAARIEGDFGAGPETESPRIVRIERTISVTDAPEGGAPAAAATAAPIPGISDLEFDIEKIRPSREEGLTLSFGGCKTLICGGTDYAVELTSGFENMDIDGLPEYSSQLHRNSFIYRFGIRTMTEVDAPETSANPPSFSTTFKMEGTSEGDETESMWDVKNFSAIMENKKYRMALYDIMPKYTPYTLSGQRLAGIEYKYNYGDSSVHLFKAKFKRPKGGKRIHLTGFRYETKKNDGFEFGINYVNSTAIVLRSQNHEANVLFGFNLLQKHKYGEAKFEWAASHFAGLGEDDAFKIENTYRKDRLNLNLSYENVGSLFRTESGFASKGLAEFNSSLQYMFNKTLTGVFGMKRRTFSDSESETDSVPFVLKFTPWPVARPGTLFEYRKNTVKYAKDVSTRDTYTDSYDLRHSIGTSNLSMTFKTERKERARASVRDLDEFERALNLSVQSPVSVNTTLTYKMNKLNNDIYGPESKNTYGLSYELSDWSDVKVSLERVNKVSPFLDRKTRSFRFGMLDPDTNAETSLEYKSSEYLLFKETFFSAKYSIFY